MVKFPLFPRPSSSVVQVSADVFKDLFPEPSVPTVSVHDLLNYSGGTWTGDKFLGGFGITKDYEIVDYWKLRSRSRQLFTENLYARGLIRRLITNEINKGLALEATPDAAILGQDSEVLAEWAEMTERRFAIWGKLPELCDYKRATTFGELQAQARTMALVSGDVLVVIRQQSAAKVPTVELVDAEFVETPASGETLRAITDRGNTIEHGVELDKAGRHVAYYVRDKNGGHSRVTRYGVRSGRLQAWLVYGTDKLIGEIRGQSILALVMQSLKEVDRYRDAEQRAAVINATIALWIKKGQDKPGSLPMAGGAVRRDSVLTQNDSNGRKEVEFSSQYPGLMMQDLQHGEEPVSYDTRRPNVNFATFEAALINAIAWANEVPPEVLTLAFANNYSASRGAVNEFKIYLDRARNRFGEQFNNPIYQDFLLSEVLNSNIPAPGFLEAWRFGRWDIYGAWGLSDWAGAIKPNVDVLKEAKAYKVMIDEGLITRERASRELNNMKYSKIVQQLARENRQFVAAVMPLIEAGLLKDQNPDDSLPEPDDEVEI